MPAPALVLLDVNETLVRLDPLRERLDGVGAPPGLLPTWFAGVLRDGFAQTLLGRCPEFRPLAESVLAGLLHGVVDAPDRAATSVLDGFAGLPLHDDVVPGLRVLAEAGCPLATLTNGSADVTAALLEGTGADALVVDRLDVQEAGAWKPAAQPYLWACERLGADPGEAVLVAAHAWDVAGARAAGLDAAYVDRSGAGWPSAWGEAPRVVAEDLPAVARLLTTTG